MEWSDGYYTDLEYTHGYYKDLNPGMLRLACLVAGIEPPPATGLRYLELGYGQGLSLNIHAAATDGEYWGTDFNPTQATQAAALAQASGADLRLFDQSFEEFAARDDLPQFDVIALHGIWSWVSDRNRAFIAEIIRKNLRIGGIAFISYNCLPGWAASMPVRHLMTLHTEFAGADIGGAEGKIEAALGFAQKVSDAGARYFQANPFLADYIKTIKDQNRNYLAHEYFNRDWRIMNFSEVAKALEPSKLSYVGSSNPLDSMDDFNMAPAGEKLLAEIGHPVLRESVRDYLVNQRFRRDIFAKGPRRLTALERRDAWLAEKFALVAPATSVSLTVKGPFGELTLHEDLYGPVIEKLAENSYAPKTLAEIRSHPRLADLDLGRTLGPVLVLAGFGSVQSAREPGEDDRRRCKALNHHLCRRALTNGEVTALASPILGGGVTVPQDVQMLVLAMQAGHRTPNAQAAYLAGIYQEFGSLTRNGQPLQLGADAIDEFRRMAKLYPKESLAQLSLLEVV